jgi:Flp pilus assembly pilin Flp
MSDFTSHTQETYRELCIRADAALRSVARRVSELPSEARGQTAAEYMGILLVVSVIIAALFGSGIGTWITNGVKDLIGDIGQGSADKAGRPG